MGGLLGLKQKRNESIPMTFSLDFQGEILKIIVSQKSPQMLLYKKMSPSFCDMR